MSKFGLSHYKLVTSDMGQLTPVSIMETLPGDFMQAQTSALIRMPSLLAPVMHPVHVRLHWWHVPFRHLWNEKTDDEGSWEDFITGEYDGTVPTMAAPAGPGGARKLMNNLGASVVTGDVVNALPIRAVNQIFNFAYRDQDLVAERTLEQTDVMRCAWEKDYFTSARPWPQKGDTITVPIGDDLPVVSSVSREQLYNANVNPIENVNVVGVAPVANTPIVADTSANTLDVRDFREAFALQRYQEARARYGSRYVEYLRYCGVRNPSDARLQNPEYLGGGKQTIAFSEVLQTAEGVNDVGTQRGHGIAAIRTKKWRRYFEEHGYLICMMSARPKAIYNDARHKLWHRQDKEDFYQKELQQVGAQEVQNRELFAQHADPTGTLGYQNRYSEYTYVPSQTDASFKATTLEDWHMARKFTTDPALNESLVECNPSKRTQGDTNEESLRCMVSHSVQARRPVTSPKTGRII